MFFKKKKPGTAATGTGNKKHIQEYITLSNVELQAFYLSDPEFELFTREACKLNDSTATTLLTEMEKHHNDLTNICILKEAFALGAFYATEILNDYMRGKVNKIQEREKNEN